MLIIEQKSGVRRHLGYPVAGLITTNPVGGSFASASMGYRFFEAYGQLEYRMNNLMPDEEARLTGKAYGSFALTGVQPNGGDTISITLSGGPLTNPVTITVAASAPIPNVDARVTLCSLMASAIAGNATLAAAGFLALSPYGSGPFTMQQVPTPQCAIICPQTFSISGGGSGACVPQITSNGGLLTPSTSLDGSTTTYGYLNILDGLEGAYASTSQNLDTSAAGPYTARATELAERTSLYQNWVSKLSQFMGIPRNRMDWADNQPARHTKVRYA